ncbi:hypothetical protein M422DRAFT_36907 [Sphaerobolus stellatus SS14]|uniref:Xanthine/uracil permease n=1 Tax=Sphaerobolus stellatus (strain SS14) TaxID=990650 RepID=A0A0C9U5G9_SPHS4|nr:hypothetical protein M422DRAFT_36907 [Sphaerobolus stellatus SS14]
MLAGLIIPPSFFASSLSLDAPTSAYLISASLIGCGILSVLQMSGIKLFGGHYIGTGLISVVGTSFSTLSVATSIFNALYKNGTSPSTPMANCTIVRGSCSEAYGMLLGTSIICSFLEKGLAFVSPKTLKRLFPPVITGIGSLKIPITYRGSLIGASLMGSSGAPNGGGGSNEFSLCPTIFTPKPLLWGFPAFIGIGFLSFISIVLTEMFGSPFLKNISIIVGLTVGSVEATGDTASDEVSCSDGLSGFFSALFIVPLLSVFAQNNGVIAITRCANITAGQWYCFLILFGVLGKISSIFLAIPNPVLGGVTTFPFASVVVFGAHVLGLNKLTRRERFILGASLSLGIADLIVPGIFMHLFDGVKNPDRGLQPVLITGLVGVILNVILPKDAEDFTPEPIGNDQEKNDDSSDDSISKA